MMAPKNDQRKIALDGWPVLALAGLITILSSFILLPLGFFGLGLMLWLAHTLRVPDRRMLAGRTQIIAPADGVIIDLQQDIFPPHQDGAKDIAAMRITILTRLTDAQLQTSPINGYITDNLLMPGMFNRWGDDPADWQNARLVNERREIRITDEAGRTVVLVQMGSYTARQLVCHLPEGKFVKAGDALGMARIGGVCDLFIPLHSQCQIEVGMHVLAGETVIGNFNAETEPTDHDTIPETVSPGITDV